MIFPDSLSRSIGCVLGAWVGDASGSILEHRINISDSEVDYALTLPGGGIFNLGPGQITDDGELTCSLLRGLINSSGSLNLNKISESYSKWFLSKPFDVGGTLRKSIPKACNMKTHQAELMRRGAKKSENSQSNGCLMRISPLAVWSHRLPPEEVFQAVSEEVKLTHPNITVQLACCFYVILAGQLIRGVDREDAYQFTKDFIMPRANQEFREWVMIIEEKDCQLIVHKPAGWVKIAFVYSVRILRSRMEFLSALREIVKKGGDTDTNACIVAALIGAADGVQGIPVALAEKVKCWEPSMGGVKRPKFLQVKYNWELIETLHGLSPESLTIIGGSSAMPNPQSNPTKP
jgi:ADP-ribosylglycohydrolase